MDNKRLQFTVTQECLDNIPTENGDIGLKKYCDKKQRNTLCCILKNTQGESELFNLIPIEVNGSYYCVKYPDPIEMLLEQAELFCKMANSILPNLAQYKITGSFHSNGGEVINFIDNNLSKQIIGYRISSLTLAIMALESFLNSHIPNDYTCVKRNKTLTRCEIEREFSIKEKLTEFKSIYNIEDKQYQDAISNIQRMVNLRNDFVHIKALGNTKNPLSDKLVESYESIMNANLDKHLKDIQAVIHIIRENKNKS